MSYFRLNEDVYLVNGKNPCIYSLSDGNVFKLDPTTAMILQRAESGTDAFNTEEVDILSKIRKMGMGEFYDKKVFIDKLNTLPDWQEYLFFKPAPDVNRVTLFLSNCTHSCEICNEEKYMRFSPCFGNFKEINPSNMLTNRLLSVLKKIEMLEARELLIAGRASADVRAQLLDYFKNSCISRIKMIICYDDNYREVIENNRFDRVEFYIQTDVSNVDHLLREERLSNKNNVSFLIIIRHGEDKVEEVIERLSKKINKSRIVFDYVFSAKDDLKEIKKMYTSHYGKVFLEDFSQRRKHSKCLYGNLTILPDGSIVPCLGLNKQIVGNVLSISEIFDDSKIYKYWNLNVNKIQKCNTCGKRYICNDCRSFELRIGGDLYSKEICND